VKLVLLMGGIYEVRRSDRDQMPWYLKNKERDFCVCDCLTTRKEICKFLTV
jgi:hypothetical protein